MSSLKNRAASRLAMLAAAALLAFAQPAAAQESAADHPEWAEVTKTLPTRYAGTTLTILMDPGSAWTNYIEASKEFEEATGITLAPTELQFGDHQQKSYLDALSKTGSFDLNHIVYMWKRNLAPALADVEELAEQVPDAPPLHLDDYIPEVLEIYGRVDGKLIGLPSLGDVTSFIWNKDHYAEAGLDPEQGPGSWEELYEVGKTLQHAPDRYGHCMPAGRSGQSSNVWILLFHAFGGQYFDADMKPQFDSEAGIKAMQFMANELKEISPPGNTTWDFPEMFTAFSTGQCSTSFMWNGGMGDLSDPAKSQVAGRFGIVPTPSVSLLGGWTLTISEYSQNKEAAYLYLSWFTSPEIVKKMAMTTGAPARPSVINDPEIQERYPYLATTVEALKTSIEFPPIKEVDQIFAWISIEANAAVSGAKTAEQAAHDLQNQVLDMMTKQGYYE